jgi:Flp pilus assembly pilin Flp
MQKIKEMVKKFWNDEEGIGMVEILLIVAVIIALALVFKKQIMDMVDNMFTKNNEKMKDLLE